MSDIPRELRSLWESRELDIAAPVFEASALRRIRSRRLITASIASVLAAAIGVATFTAVAALRGSGSPDNSAPSTVQGARHVPKGWIDHYDQRDGLSIATPSNWEYRDAGISGPLSPPIEFAVGTWRYPSGGRCAPSRAAASIPIGAAFFYIYEQQNGRSSDFPPRPRHLRLGPLEGPFECLGVKARRIAFTEQGRHFTIHVVFGKGTTGRLHAEVVRSLNTLTVEAAEPSPSPLSTSVSSRVAGSRATLINRHDGFLRTRV